MRYDKRPGCDGVIKLGNGFCWAPPWAWEMEAPQLCQICRDKNMPLFVSIEAALPAPEIEATGAKILPMPSRPRQCRHCRITRPLRARWLAGEQYCYECKLIIAAEEKRAAR